jgi:hypothetical protein
MYAFPGILQVIHGEFFCSRQMLEHVGSGWSSQVYSLADFRVDNSNRACGEFTAAKHSARPSE